MKTKNTKGIYNEKNRDNFKSVEAFKQLAKFSQWVGFLITEPKETTGKFGKIPKQLKGGFSNASCNNPNTWGSFEDALNYGDLGLDCLGFAFTDTDPFTFIDLDNCRNPDSCEIEPWAKEIVDSLNSYTEISFSGKGLHVLAEANPNLSLGKRTGNIEIYFSERFAALTGNHLDGTPKTIEPRQQELRVVIEKYFKKPVSTRLSPKLELVKTRSILSDSQVLELARKAKNSAKFLKLFNGDIQGYHSASEAIFALLLILSFYTKDRNQLDSLLRQSGLYSGEWIEKWHRLGDSQIEKAISLSTESYVSKKTSSTVTEDDDSLLDIADEVIEEFGGIESIIYSQSSFWIWNAKRGAWEPVVDRIIKRTIQNHLALKVKRPTKGHLESVLEFIRNKIAKPDSIFDTIHNGINCISGFLVFNGDTFTLTPHDKFKFLTSAIPVEFNEEAKSPRYDQCKKEIFRDDADCNDKCNLLDEMLGYSLLSDTSLEKCFILVGPGSNGKSVLLSVLAAMLGKENYSAVPPSALSQNYNRAHLRGKLANIVTEMAEGEILPDAEIKAITSGEIMTCRKLYSNPFEFRPFCTLIMASNHLPHTRDFSKAMSRRAMIIEFNRLFSEEERDTRLSEKLMAELPGILNCALNGAARLLKNRRFTMPSSCVAANQTWMHDVCQAKQFIEDRCTMGIDCFESLSQLYKVYEAWGEEVGHRSLLTRNNFRKRLLSMDGLSYKIKDNQRGILGLKLYPASFGD
jgi:putative DNA primase/helicase